MTLELMAIIAAAITLGGLILTRSRAATRERAEIRERMARLEVSLVERMARLEGDSRRAPRAVRGIGPGCGLTLPVLAPCAAGGFQLPNCGSPDADSSSRSALD